MSYILDFRPVKDGTGYEVVRKVVFKTWTTEEGKIPVSFEQTDREEIVKELKGLKEKHGIKRAGIYLPLHKCLYSIIDLPVRKKNDIEGALFFELERTFPLPIEEYVYGYKVIEKTESSSKILMLCVRKDLLSRLTGYFSEAEMEVVSVKCDFMEKLSMIYRTERKKNFIFIDVQTDHDINIAVIGDKKCKAVKHITDGTLLESEIESIQRSDTIDNIFITGDVTESIRAATGLSSEVKQWKPKSDAALIRPFSFEFLGPEMRGVQGNRSRIVAGVIAAISVGFLLAGYSWPIYRDYSELKRIDDRIEEIKAKASGLIEKTKLLEDGRARLKFLRDTQQREAQLLRVVGELSNILPKDTWIINLGVDEKGFIDLTGFSENASRLVEILEKSDVFKDVVFSAPIIASGEKSRFSIKMEMER